MIEFMTLFLFIVSGMSLGVMDTLQFHFHRSVFSKYNPQWWDPAMSWLNKYELDKDGKPLRNHHGDYKRKAWRFKLFTRKFTINKPVAATDAWHLFKSIFLNTLAVAIGLCLPFTTHWWLDAVIFRLFFGGGFNAAYNWIFKK